MLTNAVLHNHAQADGPDGMVWLKNIFENFWVLLNFKSSSSGFEEGDFLTIETSWRHWMDDTEPLLWIDSDVR